MLANEERRIDTRFIASMLACGIMSFSGVVVETAMNITFPALMSEFGVDTATVQWVTTGYLLMLTAIMPLSSYLKRRFKMKVLFAVAITFFLAGTILCALAPAFAFLIIGRLFQGVGTGVALPLMFNIVIEQAPLDKMGLMMGVATLITATAPAVGPSVGGLIVACWGWRMIFVVLLPFLIASAFTGIASIRQVSATQKAKFSVLQFVLIAAGFSCLVFGANAAAESGWLSARVLLLLLGGVALLVLFGVASLRSNNPLIRVSIFRKVPFTLSVLYVVLLSSIVLGLGYLIPYYAQTVCSSSALVAGCLLLPGCIIGAILAPLGGRILDVFGARGPLTFGAICQFVAILLFMGLALGNAVWVFAAVYVLIPIAQGFSMANSITNGLRFLPEELKADGNAAFNTLQQLGGALGTAIVTSIVGSAQAGVPQDLVAGTIIGTQEGFFALLAISGIAMVCLLVVCLLMKRNSKKA